jgi:hypothetical protein
MNKKAYKRDGDLNLPEKKMGNFEFGVKVSENQFTNILR